MNEPQVVRIVRWLTGGVAAVFGVATLFAGGRVLLGSDPGYQVFPPLLVFNTTMGLAYLVVGILIWRSPRLGRSGAGTIFILNVGALITVVVVYRTGGGVAVDSLRAMSFRTGVWMALFGLAAWLALPRSPGK